MSAAITFPWEQTKVAALFQSLDLPGGVEGAFPHLQLYPERDMALCAFWSLQPVGSLAEAIRRELLHWPDGPAVSWYLRDNTLANEQWWLNGRLHRYDGPAFISYLIKGGEFRQWVEEGQVVREERA